MRRIGDDAIALCKGEVVLSVNGYELRVVRIKAD